MKITTEIILSDNPQKEGDAKLLLEVSLDDDFCNSVVLMSGPRKDIEDYLAGRITKNEFTMRWRMKRST